MARKRTKYYQAIEGSDAILISENEVRRMATAALFIDALGEAKVEMERTRLRYYAMRETVLALLDGRKGAMGMCFTVEVRKGPELPRLDTRKIIDEFGIDRLRELGLVKDDERLRVFLSEHADD